ncbi:hypothetical protein KF840_18000 [bacterium]|nr:hypothetical protein [bacterium]
MRPLLAAIAASSMLAGCAHTFGKPPQTVSAPPEGRGRPKIILSSATAGPGATVTITATLQTGGARIAGTQNDISFDPHAIAVVRKANGRPDCRANAALGKEGTAFTFVPQLCAPGACDSMRALVLSLSNIDTIPDGSVLYTCTVEVSLDATSGAKPLRLSRVGFSDPGGKVISGVGVDGSVTVGR